MFIQKIVGTKAIRTAGQAKANVRSNNKNTYVCGQIMLAGYVDVCLDYSLLIIIPLFITHYSLHLSSLNQLI